MSTPPPLPTPYDQLEGRAFSFYPAIVGVEHNEWRLSKATWSEVLVANTGTAQEIWIPRRYLGELSKTDDPVMIVGLNRELALNAGQIIPYTRRVIEMPRAVNDMPRTPAPPGPVPVSGALDLRLQSGAETRAGQMIVGALVVVIVLCAGLFVFFRSGRQIRYAAVMQSELGFTARDDYHAVVRKLGPPASEAWRSEEGEMQYRVMRYPNHGISVILMGAERDKALYIGSMNKEWKPAHTVSLPGGGNTASLLRAIRPF